MISASGSVPFHIVLVEPEIPPNTGNVARLCAATGAALHLVEPLGFELNDRRLKRAGMDYWTQVAWRTWPDWPSLAAQKPPEARFWFVESGGLKHHAEVAYRAGDFLVFGRETAGLPRALLEDNRDRWLRVPMLREEARSLNLSNCVAIVLYEGLRQLGFPGGR
jgi:tRNA (cytidine/uridine-2'-O-)-methyltransferase